jgi:hypothetical protein
MSAACCLIARFAFLSRHMYFHRLFILNLSNTLFSHSPIKSSHSHIPHPTSPPSAPIPPNLPTRYLTRIHDQFPTIPLLRRLRKHAHHARARILHRQRRVVTHAHSLCGPVTQRRRHMARIDGEAVEPRVLRVDADGVPVHCCFGGRVCGVGDGEVVAGEGLVSLTDCKMSEWKRLTPTIPPTIP